MGINFHTMKSAEGLSIVANLSSILDHISVFSVGGAIVYEPLGEWFINEFCRLHIEVSLAQDTKIP